MNLKKCNRKFMILKLSLLLCLLVPAVSIAESVPYFKTKQQSTTKGKPVEDQSLIKSYSGLKDLNFSSASIDVKKSKEKDGFKLQGVSGELLSNNGFELGRNTTYWEEYYTEDAVMYPYGEDPAIIFNDSTVSANGDWYAWVWGRDNWEDTLISKEFTLPNYATSITLDYNARFRSSDCTADGNNVLVYLRDVTTAEWLEELGSFDGVTDPSDSQYYNHTATSGDLSSRTGHQMEIWFYALVADAACEMDLYLDDINLTATTSTNSIYRFWSNQKQGHFFTISAAEKDSIIANDHSWNYEGVAYSAFPTATVGTTPIYRFWSSSKQHHFFTVSAAEKDSIIANDPSWAYEGIAYYAYATEQSNTTAVYRFWSDVKQGHFYTTSVAEKDSIIANDHSWNYEGIAWYVPTN